MRVLSLALAALCLAAPVAAQDGSEAAEQRTVEGAGQFLKDFYRDNAAVGRLQIWAAMNTQAGGRLRATGQWVVGREPQPAGYRMDFLDGDIVGLDMINRCRTSVKLDKIRTAVFFANSISAPLQQPALGISEVIDWSKVSNISVVPATRYEGANKVETGETAIVVKGKNFSFSVRHSSDGDAKRAAFAMNFLHENCAPKNMTGF